MVTRHSKVKCVTIMCIVVLILITTLPFEPGRLKYTLSGITATINQVQRNMFQKDLSNTKKKTLNIFYFGVTHHTLRNRMLACNKTWVQTLPNMHWYSDQPDPEVNVTVVSNNGNDSYNDIVYRTLLIYKHVYDNHKGYDWYVRLWDDTYIFEDRLESLLLTQNSEFPVLIGELMKREVGDVSNEVLWICGGPGWVLSSTALNLWFDSVNNGIAIHKACRVDTLGEYLRNIPTYLRYAEDIHLSQCMLSVGVHLIHSFGFLTDPPGDRQGIVDGKTFKQKMWQPKNRYNTFCGYTTCINMSPKIGVISVHYIKPKEMFFLYNQYKIRMNVLNKKTNQTMKHI